MPCLPYLFAICHPPLPPRSEATIAHALIEGHASRCEARRQPFLKAKCNPPSFYLSSFSPSLKLCKISYHSGLRFRACRLSESREEVHDTNKPSSALFQVRHNRSNCTNSHTVTDFVTYLSDRSRLMPSGLLCFYALFLPRWRKIPMLLWLVLLQSRLVLLHDRIMYGRDAKRPPAISILLHYFRSLVGLNCYLLLSHLSP